jgi:hypothetical protein
MSNIRYISATIAGVSRMRPAGNHQSGASTAAIRWLGARRRIEHRAEPVNARAMLL